MYLRGSQFKEQKAERVVRFKPTSIHDPIAAIVVRMKTNSQESLPFTDVPMRRKRAAGFLTKKQHEHEYDPFKVVSIFFFKTLHKTIALIKI